MNRRLFALGSMVCFVVLSPIAAGAQQGASITAVGWWSQRPGAGALPDGGFEIALFPNGPVSQAALRVEVTTSPWSNALLELTESEQVLGDVARILACPTSDTWTAANPGTWSDAPTANCDAASVALGRNTTGIWTGDVTSLVLGGTSSVVLVPFSELSETQQSVTFQVVFSKARLTASAPPPPDSVPAPSSTPAYEPPVVLQIPSGPVGLFPAPVTPTPVPTTDLIAAPAEPFGGVAGDEDATGSKPWWRLLFGIPLSAVAGLGAVYARRILQRRGLGFES